MYGILRDKTGPRQNPSSPLVQFLNEIFGPGAFNAGHLISDEFGGSNLAKNIVPMEERMNKSYYRSFELGARNVIRSPAAKNLAYLFMKVNVSYEGDAWRLIPVFMPLHQETEERMVKKRLRNLQETLEQVPQKVFLTVVYIDIATDPGKVILKTILSNFEFDARSREVQKFSEGLSEPANLVPWLLEHTVPDLDTVIKY